MAWRGSISRSLLSTARSSSLRSPPAIRPLRTPSASAAAASPLRRRLPTRVVQSLLPLHSVVAFPRLTSHLSASARACCELSQGTSRRTCQDR